MKKIDYEVSHFLFGNIDENSVESTIRWIVELNEKGITDPAILYLNSSGGNLNDAFALVDIIRTSKTPISIIGIGSLISSALIIFCSGHKKLRGISKNASIMIHQFNHEYAGKYHDMKAYAEEIDRINYRMISELARTSKLNESEVGTKLLKPSDVWLTAEQLIELGIADYIF